MGGLAKKGLAIHGHCASSNASVSDESRNLALNVPRINPDRGQRFCWLDPIHSPARGLDLGVGCMRSGSCPLKCANVCVCVGVRGWNRRGWTCLGCHGRRMPRMDEVPESDGLIAANHPTPLYSLIRGWIYAEYEADNGAKPWRKLDDTSDGRRPNLGLAGPFITVSG